MIDYLNVRDKMRPGDIIVFSGRAILSYLIRGFTGSNLTHVAVVRQPYLRGEGKDVQVTESTITDGKSGPQTVNLLDLLKDYGKDCRAWWLPLSDEVRKSIDWQKFYACIGDAEAGVRYDVPGLFGFLIRSVPILGARVCQTESVKKMVCSAYTVDLLEKSGVLRGINFSKTTPQDIAEMKLYSGCIQILGEPGELIRFNTV